MTGLAKHKLYKGTLTYTVSVQSESILTMLNALAVRF